MEGLYAAQHEEALPSGGFFEILRVMWHGYCMQVHHAEVRICTCIRQHSVRFPAHLFATVSWLTIKVLQVHPVPDCPQVVPQMQRARWLHTAENTLPVDPSLHLVYHPEHAIPKPVPVRLAVAYRLGAAGSWGAGIPYGSVSNAAAAWHLVRPWKLQRFDRHRLA